MGYKVVIGKSAKTDLQNILDWYAGESISALEKFADAFFAKTNDLALRPETFGIVRQRPLFRKAKIQRFPSLIICRVDDSRSRVFISAVIHEKRNPTVWVKRLR